MHLGILQQEVEEWANRNFGKVPDWQPLIGIMEELGELSHARLKLAQGIRGPGAQHRKAMNDAVGDIVIFLSHWCSRVGIDLSEAVNETWEQVRKRDWKKNKKTGTVKIRKKARSGTGHDSSSGR